MGIRGSSVTGISIESKLPFGPESDLDLFIVSDQLHSRAVAMGARPFRGALGVGATLRFPALASLEQQLTRELGRKSSIRIFSEAAFNSRSTGFEVFGP